MNCRTITLLLLLLFKIPAWAQANFKRADLITLKGDTLQGYVNYKEWTRSPTHFQFKTALSEKGSTTYTAANLQKLLIEGYESYERFVVPVSMNEVDESRLDPAAAPPPDKKDTVFLRVVASGSYIQLFFYRDKMKERFYVLMPPQTTPEELRYSIQLQDNMLSAAYTFRQQLNRLASSFPSYTSEVKDLVAAAPYSENALKKIANTLNGINEAKLGISGNMYKRGRFFGSVGVNHSGITYEGWGLVNANGLDGNENTAYTDRTTHSNLPIVSVGYDVFFHPSVGRSYFRTEVTATAIRSEIHALYKYQRPYDEELAIQYRLSGILLALTPQLGYAFYQQPKLSLHAGAGASLRYSAYPTQTFHQDTNKEGPGYKDVTAEDYFNMKHLLVIPTAHAGAIINKKFGFSVNWFKRTKIVDRADDPKFTIMKIRSLYFNFTYLF